MDINDLVKVTTRAWALEILALMQGGVPGRQAALLAACGAGRTAFGQSLRHLIDLGMLERNPGHGHPLRPEYRLTKKGVAIAALAERINQLAPQPASGPLLRRAWTIPVLAVSERPRHFSDIKGRLGGVTDRALSQSLKRLEQHQWVERRIDAAARPPRPLYRAINTGDQISRAVQRHLPLKADAIAFRDKLESPIPCHASRSRDIGDV